MFPVFSTYSNLHVTGDTGQIGHKGSIGWNIALHCSHDQQTNTSSKQDAYGEISNPMFLNLSTEVK